MGIMDPMDAPTVTLSQAIELTGKSRSTIRRRKADLERLGAVINPKGWTIPVPALIATGLLDNVSKPAGSETGSMNPQVVSERTPGELEKLRLENIRLRERTEQQEQRIADLQAQISDQRTAMKLLEAAPAREHKRGLWSRFFGR